MNLHGWRQPKRGRWHLETPRLGGMPPPPPNVSAFERLLTGAAVVALVGVLLWTTAWLPVGMALPLLGTTTIARLLDAIPLVDSTSERTSRFPSPTIGQRVENLETGAIERYSTSGWGTDIPAAAIWGAFHVRHSRFAGGAKFDGATNDAPAFQAVLTAITAEGGGSVWCGSNGTAKINSQLAPPAHTAFLGTWGALLDFQGVGTLPDQGGVIHASGVDDVVVRGVRIIGGADNNVLSFHGCNDVRVEHCSLSQGAGIPENTKLVGIYDNPVGAGTNSRFWILDNYFKGSDEAVLVQGRTSGPWNLTDVHVNRNTIDGSAVTASPFGAIKIDLFVFRFEVNDNIINGAGLIKDAINVQENCRWGTVNDNIITACTRNGILLEDGQSGGVIEDIGVEDNIISGITGQANSRGISLNYANGGFSRNISISGNILSDIAEVAINENTPGAISLKIHDNTILNAGTTTAVAAIRVRSLNVSVEINVVSGTPLTVSLLVAATATGHAVGNTFLQSNGTTTVSDLSAGGFTFSFNNGYPVKAFDTASANTGQDRLFLRDIAGVPGDGVFGSGLGFSGIGGATARRAAVVPVQRGADADVVGLAGFTHPSGTFGDPVELAFEALRGFWSPFYRDRVSTPAQIVANQDDYDPGVNGWLRLSSDASRQISSLLRGSDFDGRELRVTNVGAFNLTFPHETGPTASTRILTPDGLTFTLLPGRTTVFKYDSASSRWRIV